MRKKSERQKAIEALIGLAITVMILIGVISTVKWIWGKIKSDPEDQKKAVEEIVGEPIETESNGDPIVYGAYDDRVFTHEISMDWGGDEFDFTPIDCDLDPQLQEFTYCLCKGYDIDFTLIMAIMMQESSFRSDLISSTNDYGLMQINKCNHEWITKTIGVDDFLNPEQNIRAGVFVIRKLFEKYTDPEMVLMSYHFGDDGAQKLWKAGIYESKYSQSVLNYQKQFNEEVGE